MTFWETLFILIIFLLIMIFIINLAMKRMYQTSVAIKKEVENFKIPKIKITDLIGYAGYQIFEMAKPGIRAKVSEWAKDQLKDTNDTVTLKPDQYEVK